MNATQLSLKSMQLPFLPIKSMLIIQVCTSDREETL